MSPRLLLCSLRTPGEGSSIIPGILAGHCGLIPSLLSFPYSQTDLSAHLGASALKTHGFLHLAPPSTPLASQTWMLPGTCFIPLAASSPACTVTLLAHPVTPKVLLRAYTALRPVLSDLSSRYSLLHSSPQASSLPCQTL